MLTFLKSASPVLTSKVTRLRPAVTMATRVLRVTSPGRDRQDRRTNGLTELL